MGLKSKLQRLLGLVEGHEDAVAKQVSKRTSVSRTQARQGIEKAREFVDDESRGKD